MHGNPRSYPETLTTLSKNEYGTLPLSHTQPSLDKCIDTSIPTLKDLRGSLIVTIRERMVNPIPTLEQSMSIHILRE